MTSLPALALVFALGFVARIFVEAHSKINRDLKSIQQDVPADVGRDE